MRLTRRDAAKLGIGLGAGVAGLRLGLGPASAEEAAALLGTGVRTHGHSLVAPLRYGSDFAQFDYVDPAAPKGGSVSYEAGARFDSLNPYNIAGSPSFAARLVVETLMVRSLDEGSTHYGLLAEWMEAAEDDSWVAFRLRDAARWHDGRPVTVDDAIFSFEALTRNNPFYGAYYANVARAVDLGDRTVLFEFDQSGNKELPHIMGQLDLLPAHWWEDRDFGAVILEPLLGSGPYRIAGFEAPRHVDLERVPDYWGADLPVRIGSNNFDRMRLEYISEDIVAFDAFKVGDLLYREENEALKWATLYDFPAIRRGEVVKENIALDGPQGVSGFFYNLRRPKFQDRRVREALNTLLDFENLNRVIYYDQYARPISYFQGTPDLMASGLPDAAELALLEPHRDALPPALFEQPFEHPVTDGSGELPRSIRRRAARLLDEAGWPIAGGERVGPDGEPLSIEFLTSSDALERTIQAYARNLNAAGIRTVARVIDPAQFTERVRAFDYDCLLAGVANSESPGNEQRDFWSSDAAAASGSRNYCGVANPVVDALIERIVFAEDRAGLAAACRALDRVLLFEYYVTLRAYSPFERIAYWRERIAHPEPLPSRSIGFPTVWWSKSAEDAG